MHSKTNQAGSVTHLSYWRYKTITSIKSRNNVFLILLFISCIVNAGEKIPPGYLYKGSILNIKSPNSDGWEKLDSSSAGMSFARPGKEKYSSYGAQVSAFKTPKDVNPEDFLIQVKQAIAQDTDNKRFTLIEEEVELSNERTYICVRFKSITKDKKAKISTFKRSTQFLQIYSLYCNHPTTNELGFAAIYSYRGPTPLPDLQAEANEFINGIRVPNEKH